MKTPILLSFVFALFTACSGLAQKKNEAASGKIVQIIPDNDWIKSEDPDVIIFPMVFIWEYETEWLEPDEYGREGQLWAYYHPELKYWLFTTETYGYSAEMFSWVLVKPDGTVIMRSRDEFGKSDTEIAQINFNKDKSVFEVYKANGQKKKFNENDMGFPAIEGDGYTVTFEWVSDVAEYFLADTDVNFAPLHNFQLLNELTEAYIVVPFSNEIPDNYLLLEAKVTTPFGVHKSTLKDISHTYYEINLKDD